MLNDSFQGHSGQKINSEGIIKVWRISCDDVIAINGPNQK